MSERKRKKGSAHASKRNNKEIHLYKSFLTNPQNQPDDTVDVCNASLRGTDFLQFAEDTEAPSPYFVPAPWSKRIARFFKDHGIIAVIITAFLSFGAWTVTQIHQNDVELERLKLQLEHVENAVDRLSSNGVEIDVLDDEISDLKTELEYTWKLDIKSIENKISIIELQVDNIENRLFSQPNPVNNTTSSLNTP